MVLSGVIQWFFDIHSHIIGSPFFGHALDFDVKRKFGIFVFVGR